MPAYPVQKGCEPLNIAVPPSVPVRGSVLMFHGLSACPQQYLDLGNLLAAKGFQVFVPLLPGHGRVPVQADPRLDDISDLPLEQKEFGGFSASMALFLSRETGERVVVGTSLGGAYALEVATRMAAEDAPATKVVGLVPMLGITHLLEIGIIAYKTCALLPRLCRKTQENKHILSFGDICEKTEIPRGRGGYCQFMTQHVDSMVEFSKKVAVGLKEKAPKFKSTKFLFVMGEGDIIVPVEPVQEVRSEFTKMGVESHFWSLPKPAGHSLISPYDSPFDKPWLGDVVQSVVKFVDRGVFQGPV